jgi:Tol biopolymer transport system component
MTVPPSLVLEQLERMLGRPAFRAAGRSSTLLRFLVVETLEGRADRLKDYTLGSEALGRGDGFDPRIDPIARVEASRLRSRLELYYATEGSADPVVISLPKGGYVPQFLAREPVQAGPVVQPDAGQPARTWLWPWRLLAFGFAAATVALAVAALRSGPEVRPAARDVSEFTTPATFDPVSLAIAPDGQKLVVTGSQGGIARLLLRRFSGTGWEPLEGTEGATLPFWSPDGESVGFFARSWIQRIDLQTGVVRRIARIAVPAGAAWGRDDMILFPLVPDSALWTVAADGGTARAVTRLAAGQTGHRAPHFFPDGRQFLFYAAGAPEVRGIYLGSLEDGSARFLFRSDSPAIYSRGHVLYVEQRTLFARPFDPARPDSPGPARALAEGIAADEPSGIAAFSVSPLGTLVYRQGTGGKRQLVRVRGGDEIGRVGAAEPRGPFYPSLSRDGTRLAVQRSRAGNTDILVLDLRHPGAETYVTETPEPDIAPVWGPRDDRIAYAGRGTNGFDLWAVSVVTGQREPLFASAQSKQPTDWSDDDTTLLFRTGAPQADWDVWALKVGGEAFPVVRNGGDDRDAQFSPGGTRFIVYQSERHDVPTILVQAFPTGEARAVSTNGGVHPRWSRDGGTIYYIDLDGWLVSVPFTAALSGSAFTVGAGRRLFPSGVGHLQDTALPHYVVVGKNEFLVDRVVEEVPPPVVRVLNWETSSSSGPFR